MTIQLNGKTPTKICMFQPPRLPAEYQEVEYIESSGTQYLQIGSSFKTSYKTVIDFQMTVTGGDQVPVGLYTANAKRYGLDAWQGYFKVITGGSDWSNTKSEDKNRHTITIDKSTVTVDGTNYSCRYSDVTFSYGIGVFTYIHSIGREANSSNKLYKLDIYDENGTHIHDLVPCYRIADTEIGMYDIITDTFYTNQGTGTFTKGNDVSSQVEKQIKKIVIFPDGVTEKQIRPVGRIPSEYQEVEYIQSTGTQFIDTGYLITPNTEVSADFQFTDRTGQPMVFGVGSDTNTTSGMTFCIYCNGTNTFKAGISNGSSSSGSKNTWTNYGIASDTNKHTFVLNNGHFITYNSSGTLELDITTSRTFTRTATHSFGLFCWRRLDTSAWANKASGKLYGCIVKENGTLQREFVPCYRKADTVIGMYDLVNNTFYTNSGSGTFTKGPDVN